MTDVGCGCNKAASQFEVVVDGKVVFTTPARHTADAVSKRYPGATVRQKPTGNSAR